jgi:hypothetical protein
MPIILLGEKQRSKRPRESIDHFPHMKKKAVIALLTVDVLLVASCATTTPSNTAINDHARLEEQIKGYPDRESREYRQAEQAEAQKQSMLTGKVK